MSLNLARSFPRPLALACLALVAACAGAPDLAIVAPAPDSTVGPAQDIDPATPGMQLAVDATTSAPDGSSATAVAGGARVFSTAQGGRIHFASVTFAEGAATLILTVVSQDHDKLATTEAHYSVDSFSSGCRITSPANGSTITADPGDTGLVSVPVKAICRGVAGGVQAGLLENGDAQPSQLQTPAGDGSVSFTATLIPGKNLIQVAAAGVPYDAVLVTLVSTRCRVELQPPSGARFNLDGAGGAIADLDPGTQGVQAALTAQTSCADGSPASLSISANGTVAVTASATVSGGQAVFDVTLPDGALDAQAFVGAPGAEGASRPASYFSDGQEPSITILTPVQGGLLGPQDDVGTGDEFVARVRGEIAGLDSGGFAALEVDQGTSQAQEVAVVPDLTNGIFSTDITLAPGPHTLYAEVQRSSGNLVRSATIDFTVVLQGTALTIVSPADGSDVGLSQLVAVQGGAQLTVQLQSANLGGQTASVDCGSGLTGSAPIGLDGKANISLMLPISSCAGALFRCVASAGSTGSASVTFTADDTAPTINIAIPAAGSTSATSTEFKATTSCAGEGQLYTLDNGGTVISTGSVQNNLIDLASVALHSGQNQLHLTVADGAGNSSTSEVDVTSSSSAFPTVSFVTPQAGDTLTAGSANLTCAGSAPTLNQVQVSITGDTVTASGLVLKLTNSSGTQTVSQVPTESGGVWTWSNLPIAPGSNTFSVTATDAAMAQGQASVTFSARCAALNVQLTFAVSGNSFGYAQDKDHTTAGVQVDAQVQSSAANGSAVRLCSTALAATPGACTTAGTGQLTVVAGTAQIQSGIATFTVTIPDGQQTVYAEVSDVGTDVSSGHTLTARSTPPVVQSIAVAEDTQGQLSGSGPDDALNQTELDAANGTLHFNVVFGANSFVAEQTVQIFSTTTPGVLGQATVAADGDGATATTVPVALAQLNPGGYQSYIFYALVSDDAGNKDSTPSNPVAGVAATTLGTAGAPFVIAPDPTVTLTSPAPGTPELNASDDARCVGGVCPGADPLIYPFGASTSAPDSSTSGATTEITFLSGGSPISPAGGEENPVAPSGGEVSGDDLPIANGAAVSLAAEVLDPYGNQVTSAVTTLAVDTIAPQLAITSLEGRSAAGGAVTIDEPSVEAVVTVDGSGGGTLEAGQTITIFDTWNGSTAAVGSAVYSGSSTGAGTADITLSLASGAHTLVAKTTDAAGNPGASSPVVATQTYTGPTVVLSSPAPVSGGTLWFGTGTKSGSGQSAICAPQLSFTTTNVPDGQPLLVWLVSSGQSCGSAPGTAQSVNVTGNSATLSSAPFAIADGNIGRLCAQATDGSGNTVVSAPQTYQCDLQTPVVSWISPTANQLFVGNGQTQIASATPSTSSDNTKLGLAAAQLSVTAKTGGTLVLSVDKDNTPSTTTVQFVSCSIAASASVQTVYAIGAGNCTTTSSTGQLLAPIDYAQLLAHTLSATLTAPSGNTSATATQSIRVDVAEPAAVTVSTSVQHAIGVVTVTIPAVPGDDQTTGASPASWEVRYSSSALTASNWGSGTLVTANLAGAFPTGVPTSFQVVLPSGNASLSLGVRAKDRVGNLGDVGANSIVSVSTQASGTVVAIKDDTGGPPTTSGQTNMRVADLDGDGFDDIVLSYPGDACHPDGYCDGRIIVYFGGFSGGSDGGTPLVLKGQLVEGFLGAGEAFDVGDFDGDGKADIAASEWDGFTGDDVLIWRGANMAAAKASGIAPTPVVLTDSAGALLGGTVRAAGKITGGSGAGSDLLLSNYQTNDESSAPYKLAILPRGGSWSTAGSSKIFAASGSPATAFITLPSQLGTDSGFGAVDQTSIEAAPFTYAAASGDLAGLAISMVYIDNQTPYPGPYFNEHEARAFGGDAISAGGTLSWSSGTLIPSPSGVTANTLYGYNIAGGRDAIGDTHRDVLFANADSGALYLYDGTQLLGTNYSATPSITEYANSEAHPIGKAATLLADLDGDGKAEIAGGADPLAPNPPAYFWFGQTGDAVLPALPFDSTSCGSATATSFCMVPPRGQELSGAPVFTNGNTFGQAVASGHITSTTGRDLVILSQPQNSSGGVQGYVVVVR